VFFMCFVDQETAAWGAEYMSGATSKGLGRSNGADGGL
jgi:hypothetical protein